MKILYFFAIFTLISTGIASAQPTTASISSTVGSSPADDVWQRLASECRKSETALLKTPRVAISDRTYAAELRQLEDREIPQLQARSAAVQKRVRSFLALLRQSPATDDAIARTVAFETEYLASVRAAWDLHRRADLLRLRRLWTRAGDQKAITAAMTWCSDRLDNIAGGRWP